MTSMSWNSDPSLCNSLPLSMGRTCDLLLTKEHHKGEGIYITHDYGAWDCDFCHAGRLSLLPSWLDYFDKSKPPS